MSKDKNSIVQIPVEKVENLIKILEWCSQTIDFWKLNNEWPTNLIKDVIDDTELYLNEFVSRSHINDK